MAIDIVMTISLLFFPATKKFSKILRDKSFLDACCLIIDSRLNSIRGIGAALRREPMPDKGEDVGWVLKN